MLGIVGLFVGTYKLLKSILYQHKGEENMKEQTKARKLKVYNQSRGNYNNIPTIILKGHWLKEYGFEIDKNIILICNKEEIIIKTM